MREFVAECGDTVGGIVGFGLARRGDFVGAGIAIEALAVKFNHSVVYFKGMWPHRIFIIVVSLAIAGIDHKHIVDVAVVVVVVFCKVDLASVGFYGLYNHLKDVRVIISAIVCHVVLKLHRAVDLKCGVEKAVRLLLKVIMSRAHRAVFLEAGLIELACEIFLRVGGSELHIRKFNQEDKTVAFACAGERKREMTDSMIFRARL